MSKKAEPLSMYSDVLDVTMTADASAGDVLKVEDVYGYLIADVKTGEEASLQVSTSNIRGEKVTNQTWKAGEAVYWSASGGGKFTNVRSSALVGYATKAAAATDTHGHLKFDGFAAVLKA